MNSGLYASVLCEPTHKHCSLDPTDGGVWSFLKKKKIQERTHSQRCYIHIACLPFFSSRVHCVRHYIVSLIFLCDTFIKENTHFLHQRETSVILDKSCKHWASSLSCKRSHFIRISLRISSYHPFFVLAACCKCKSSHFLTLTASTS